MPSLTPDGRSELLLQLRADQSQRWNRGEAVPVEYYLGQYPDLASNVPALLHLIHSEVLLRLEHGEQPSLDEYLQRFPQHSDDLRRGWAQLLSICPQLASGSGGTTTIGEQRTVIPEILERTTLPSLPGFDLESKLGEGGMGVVFRARDVRLGRTLAIKVIRAGPFAGSEAHDRFQREARAMAQLGHPAVVPIYALGEHADVLYICMELLEGGSLQGRLRRGPLAPREAASLVRQVALGVQHAHENGILHRDLKPANVLLSADGEPKVSDFGLAKLLDADDGFTQSGTVMGTPAYMAPEQAEDSGAIGPPADVWALGVILYESLTGEPPFRAERRGKILERVKTQPPVPPSQVRPEVPAELERICLKCLVKQPEGRYASAAALAGDLQAWLDGLPIPVEQPPVAPAPDPERPPARWRRRLIVGLVLLAVLASGLLAYLFHPDRPLWQIQARLRRGEAVELIGPGGKPAWSRWWLGGEEGQALVGPDGAFVVNGWPVTLLELLPDTGGHQRYRLHAEVRHVKSGERGRIGLFFAGTTNRSPGAGAGGRSEGVPVLSFLQLTFDDLHDEGAPYRSLPEPMRKLIPPPKGNRVRLGSCLYAEPARQAQSAARPGELPNRILDHEATFVQPELFKPAGHGGKAGEWRTIRIDVSPERIRVFWAGKPLKEVRPAAVLKQAERDVEQLRKKSRDNPALDGLVPGLDLTGGLGLYLHASYASFRNVWIEPPGVENAED